MELALDLEIAERGVADPNLGAMVKARVRGMADLAWLSGCARDRSCLLFLGTGAIRLSEAKIIPSDECGVSAA
jgi:hypothetical protein